MGRRRPARLPLALAVAFAVLGALGRARTAGAQTNDTTLQWMTLETAHFRIHYYQGLRPVAERVAAVGEGIYTRVGALVGNPRPGLTDVVVTDGTDYANGSATAFPYNTVRVYATAPEDLSTLGDYDDWIQALVTHEFTHLSQFDNISGIPAFVNAILGRVLPPNQLQPRWILEGIAVYSETRNTTGGRLRSSVWDMWMRADALGNNLATLDQVTAGPNRWPHGNIWYLYGSHFIQYIMRRFGDHVLADISRYYGGQLVPFGFNRAVRRATGFTYEELYPQFLASLRAQYGQQRDAIVAAGLEEGERLTFHGENQEYPRFFPGTNTVVYQSSDGQSHAQLRAIDAGPAAATTSGTRRVPRDGDWVASFGGFAFTPDGARMVLSDTGFYRAIYAFNELYTRDVRRSSAGTVATTANTVITDGARAWYPDVSPDGDHVAFAANHRGTSALYEMSLAERSTRQIAPVLRFEQVYTPRYSPDGSQIVFSQWQRGGYRDIRVFDRATGAVRDLTHDRAVDMQPVFSPDGRYVVWSSDRTGVSNLHAMELATGRVWQVTNVVHGAFMPAISPDGRTLVYVGYTHLGYDLYRLPFDPTRWRDAVAPPAREGAHIPTPPVASRTHPYDPLPTLRPYSWLADLSGSGYNQQVALTVSGGDVVGLHTFAARVGATLQRGDFVFDASYGYHGQRVGFGAHLYRAIGTGRWRFGRNEPTFPVEVLGGDVALSVSVPELFAGQSLSVSYGANNARALESVPVSRYADPSDPPNAPSSLGLTAYLGAAWSFQRVQGYAYSVSAQEGYAMGLGVRVYDRALGSSFGAVDFQWSLAGYVPMPWGQNRRRHVLALHLVGGLAATDVGPRGLFAVGGFPGTTFDGLINQLVALSPYSGVVLRGYEQGARAGSEYHLANAEYRFPIAQIDRGPSTLPLYLRRLHGAVFVDVGNAYFGGFRLEDLAVGAGGELLLDLSIGYFLEFTFRAGLARGLVGTDAITQPYFVLSSPF